MTEYSIKRLGHHGDGIADGPVFAPLTLPGETVTGTLEGNRLSDIRIVKPSADRVAPPCRHFKACGGCQVQHASDDFVARWKTGILRTALEAQGITADFRPIAVSPPRSRRRATFAARRTKKGAMAGFHAKGSDIIVEIPGCQLLHPDLVAAVPVAEALAVTGASRKGGLDVAITMSGAGLDVSVSGGKPLDGPLRIELAHLASVHDLARLVWDDEIVVIRRNPEQSLGGIAVVPPPGAFLQATKAGEETLQADVLEIVDGAARVADLFAGCGTFALPIARRSAVHAVEGDAAMTGALDQGWRRAERLKAVTTEVRDLFRQPLVAEELGRFDAIVLDPPRAGAEAQAAQIAAAGVPIVAYVSCSPVTFARDARRLVDSGYVIDWVRAVDQFRWSSHVELVAAFRIKTA
jgi:23S rRNA (uracil1939-C5)-methyltransferase